MWPGFCKSGHHAEIGGPWPRAHARAYVGAEGSEDDGEPFEVKIAAAWWRELKAQYGGSRRSWSRPSEPNLKGGWFTGGKWEDLNSR